MRDNRSLAPNLIRVLPVAGLADATAFMIVDAASARRENEDALVDKPHIKSFRVDRPSPHSSIDGLGRTGRMTAATPFGRRR